MSYILDALRKSEHERQMATGKITGMLYPIQVEHRRSAAPWIVLASVVVLLLAAAVVWWLWPQAEPKIPDTVPQPITADSFPKLQQPHLMSEPEDVVVATANPPVVAKIESRPRKTAEARISSAEPAQTNVVSVKPPETGKIANPAPVSKTEAVPDVDPLADMPELKIYGYVHNEFGGSFAMINDRLLQDGDEIAPGLKLVKVLEGKAIFNYKGHEFTR